MQKDRQILTEIKKNGQKEGHIKKEQPERRTDSQKEEQTGNPYHDNLLWRNCDFNQFVDETRITIRKTN